MTRFPNCSEVLIGRLRRKIDDGFEPKLITTLAGRLPVRCLRRH